LISLRLIKIGRTCPPSASPSGEAGGSKKIKLDRIYRPALERIDRKLLGLCKIPEAKF